MTFDFTDNPGSDLAEIDGPAATIKRAFGSILVDECKINLESDGIHTEWVNPPNVMAGTLTIPDDTLETYDLATEGQIGLNTGDLSDAIRPARVSADDTVSLSVAQRQIDSWVDREYDDGAITFHDVWRLIDPDSIREFDGLPELDLVEIDLSAKRFTDAVESVGRKYEHIDMVGTDDGLELRGHDDTSGAEATIHTDLPDEFQSIYSKDFLVEIAAAVRSLQPDSITVRIAEEYPLFVDWERPDGVSGTYMLAPRIRKD